MFNLFFTSVDETLSFSTLEDKNLTPGATNSGDDRRCALLGDAVTSIGCISWTKCCSPWF